MNGSQRSLRAADGEENIELHVLFMRQSGRGELQPGLQREQHKQQLGGRS